MSRSAQTETFLLTVRQSTSLGMIDLEKTSAVSLPVGSRFPIEVTPPFTVRTARMLLRPLRESDRREYVRVLGISRESLASSIAMHRQGESDEQYFHRQLALTRAGDAGGTAWRRVGVLDDGTIVGMFTLNPISRGLEFRADASWWISAERCGAGYGTEGVQAMVDHALAELPRGLGLHIIQAAVLPSNTASTRVATKVGFRKVAGPGTSIRIAGDWKHHDLYEVGVLSR